MKGRRGKDGGRPWWPSYIKMVLGIVQNKKTSYFSIEITSLLPHFKFLLVLFVKKNSIDSPEIAMAALR